MKQTRFTREKMRHTMYEWHGGQWSALYAAASSGLVDDVTALQTELRACAGYCEDPMTRPYASDSENAAEARYLRALADALPSILTDWAEAWDGRMYRRLPWAKT